MSSREAPCCSKPRIVVTNLRDGEVLPHSIVLVKGRVERQCPVNGRIVLCIEGGDSVEPLSEPLSGRGEFKFLVDFGQQPQRRQLVLQHCRESLAIEVYSQPLRKPYRLQPLLITCQDQQEAEATDEYSSICEKIDLNLRLVQCVYAEKLHEAGHGRLTFCLDSPCRVFRCSLTLQRAWQLGEEELWQHIAGDLLAAFPDDRLKFVAFVACTRYDAAAVNASGDYSYANIRRHLRGHAALGGGGLALFGSAFFYAWPQHFAQIVPAFRSQQPVDLSSQPDESNYRRTYGGVYASTLGAVCHELGHSFDLGHSRDGVMGDGFDYLNRVFLVESTTEHLPQRLVDPSTQLAGSGPPRRFTQLKKTSCAFLDKYHEQKQNDSFFFSAHCALILANHKWLRHDDDEADDSCDVNDDAHEERAAEESVIVIDSGHQAVESKGRHGLILVEVRSKANSLVDSHYDLRQPHRSGASSFHFAAKDRRLLFDQQTHYVFAMTSDGRGEKLLLSSCRR